MIVEFIGCTGAGKTMLISKVRNRLAEIAEVTTSYELVAAPLGLQGIRHSSARNIIQEIVGLPFFIRSLFKNIAFIGFNLRILARQTKLPFFTFNNLRSLERKVGVYELIKRNGHGKIILVDEGTVLQAHHLFVFNDWLYTSEELARFSCLLPMPDMIIYVRAPLNDLIQRSLQRADPPRIMRNKNQTQNEIFLRRANAMFEELIETEQIKNRVLIVDNPDSMKHKYENLVQYIVESILNFKLSTNGKYSSFYVCK